MTTKTNSKIAADNASQPFKEEWIQVGDLEVDHRVQRDTMNLRKVERMIKFYNPAALGVITVSQRNQVTRVIIDGMHRWQTVKEVTDNQGEVLCHVFEGLTLSQEAQMFLDLNYGNQPSALEKFKVRIVAEDPVALEIDKLIRSYNWTIGAAATNGVIQAIGALERVYLRGVRAEVEPNPLQVALLVASRSWGQDRFGVQAVILEGLGSFYAEHQDKIDLDHLVNKLSAFPSGPRGLHTDATQLASLRRLKVTMAVADLVTNEYNRGRGASKTLPPWRRRNP